MEEQITHVETGEADDDLEIEIVDDRPEEDRNRPPVNIEADDDDELSDDEIKALGGRAQKRIKKLTWQYHEERRAKEQAERLAQESVTYSDNLTRQNRRLKDALKQIQEETNKLRQRSTESDVAMAQARLAAALEEGNAAQIAEAQTALTNAQLGGFVQPTGPRLEPEPDVGAPTQMPRPEPRAVAWQKSNPWFGVDTEMTSLAYGVHERLVREGVDTSSDEYYNRIDQRMREVFPQRFDDTSGEGDSEQPEPRERRSSRSPVAPATRTSGSTPRKRVELTATQVALAKRLGLTPQQYAKQLLKEQMGAS